MRRSLICVFTGSRAEYGLLKPLLIAIRKHPHFRLKLVVSGAHLSSAFCYTYKQIKRDGFKIDEKVKMLLNSDTETGISKSLGLGIVSYADTLDRIRPDLVILLGDRFEAFAFATASHIHRIPIAHLHGGETTEGAIDEAFRHAITKMSHLHFTSTDDYRKRVIQLGEEPRTVFNVGAIGLDNIRTMKLLTRSDFEKKTKFTLGEKNLIVTFHPVTLEKNSSMAQFKELLKFISIQKKTKIIFTKANADTNGRIINKMIDKFVKRYKYRACSFASMGSKLYLSALQYVDAVVGNSSSGIIEAPSFKIGTINIGDRQNGRIKAKSIIDSSPVSRDINMAFKKLYSSRFQSVLKKIRNPYGNGHSTEMIINMLEKNLDKIKIKKSFHDIIIK
ncbi:UDP-N-acetylglucosamine 2-epimerase [Spirochaetota bacterium]